MSFSTIVWFRQDLRLEDNSALAAAIERGIVQPVFIWDQASMQPWAVGGASQWWLHHALRDLAASIEGLGGQLSFQIGEPLSELRKLTQLTGASAVFWNRRYEPASIDQDSDVKAALREDGLEVCSFNSRLLFEPWEVQNGSGDPYRVFTPFSKNILKNPLPAPESVRLNDAKWFQAKSAGVALDDLKLLPKIQWDSGMSEMWDPTREGAMKQLERFLAGAVETYHDDRDIPSVTGTSALSPYLNWGQIGPREIAAHLEGKRERTGGRIYFSEILWREFAYHILFHFPHTTDQPLQEKYAQFPWQNSPDDLEAWKRGRTGYPIVDAGMRQLWATGWMHNRVRMVVASLLVKHLLLPWQEGAKWFWDTLIDADLASNSLGWQWAGGCGADAAPYFRIFNPIIQGKKFDTDGDYVRRWVPELARVPAKFIHCPWEASEIQLRAWGVTLGDNYPYPIIEHSAGRDRALNALQELKKVTNG